MFLNFSIAKTPELYIKPGIAYEYFEEKLKSSSIILVTGNKSFLSSEKGQEIFNLLNNICSDLYHVRISREPSPDDINNALSSYFKNKIDYVIAIGGGSAIDAGKAISAMLTVGGDVKDYLEGVGDKIHPGSKIPMIAVPTTAGTGSEATKNAVITEVGEKGFKKSLRHNNFVPDIVLIDPLLHLSNSFSNTASTGMDAFTQLVESFLSVKANTYTDTLALEGIKNIILYLEKSCYDRNNLEARTGMAYAAYLSGITLANAGLGIVHGFAQPLGGFFNIPHGIVCGTLMSVVNKITLIKAKENNLFTIIKKYATLGRLINNRIDNDDLAAELFIQYLQKITKKLQIPLLSDFNIDTTHFNMITDNTGNKNHPLSLTKSELNCILQKRL